MTGRTNENASELTRFRSSFDQRLSLREDALFELCDATLCSRASVSSLRIVASHYLLSDLA